MSRKSVTEDQSIIRNMRWENEVLPTENPSNNPPLTASEIILPELPSQKQTAGGINDLISSTHENY